MRLTTWGHACVRLDHHGGRLLLDPGSFSDLNDAVADVATVLVTHEHADHLAVGPVARLVRDRGVRVLGPRAALDLLVEADAPADLLDEVRPGDSFDLDGLAVRVTGGLHAEIHPDVPRVANVGYLAGGVYHPGDSTDDPAGEVRVLLAPVGGPWLRLAAMVDLARQLHPHTVVPIHDAMLTDVGHALVDRIVQGLLRSGEYRRLTLGENLDVD
jgi:L-ascorbate metabolism protein UlaG (beta-lactamase superfamily)